MKPRYSVKLSPTFRGELADIQRYITFKYDAPKEAEMLALRINNAANSLNVFPKIYRVRKTDAEGRELRVLHVDGYAVVYSVNDEKNIVDVLHVFHGRRNIDALI